MLAAHALHARDLLLQMLTSACGTWQTVRGTAAFRQNLEVELTKTERRSRDRL
jgi:hypothetical protein